MTSAWWRTRAQELTALVKDGQPRYVYDLSTIRARAQGLQAGLPSIDAFHYSMKANCEPTILKELASVGWGLECVSGPEILQARKTGAPLLFVPNFCALDEFDLAFRAGAEVVIDSPEVLVQAPSLFHGKDVGLRLDPGWGEGHHPSVVTGGDLAKFGVFLDDVPAVVGRATEVGARIVGLHAHVGSGILDPDTWGRVGELLLRLRAPFPALRWVSMGGGLGVPERPSQEPLDLARVEDTLARVRRAGKGLALRLEPGRYLVSEAGVLLAPVTQVREKGGLCFAGVAAGMNTLIRPALYGAWHGIHNLSRLSEEPTRPWEIVGPICESGDVLGHERWIPDPRPGDVLLIENAGAYGAVMSSRYNLREFAEEVVLG